MSRDDVVIIGAGISGISVAYHLIMNNYNGNIIILEANDRIGGRINSHVTQYDDKVIEYGAQWIHGIMGNPIYEFAIKHNVINQLSDGSDCKHIVEAKTFTGETIDTSIVADVYRAYFYFIKRCENYYQLSDSIGPLQWDNSTGKHLKSDINSWIEGLKNDDDNTKRIKRNIFGTLLNRETCISGAHTMDDVSLSHFGSYTELPGGNVTIPRGYRYIINGLLEEIHAKLASCESLSSHDDPSQHETQFSILKSHKVIKINWGGVKVSSSVTSDGPMTSDSQMTSDGSISSKTKVKIVCENGYILKANHVVVTLPLGVLKKEADHIFEPKLPNYKLECINSLGFGFVNKIYLQYRVPLNQYINPNVNEIILLWDDDDDDSDVYDNVHDDVHDDIIDKYKWYRKIYSIRRLTNHCLQLWVSGEEAKHVEKMTDDNVNGQLTRVLRKFCHNEFPRADHVTITKWGSNPYSYGSYSYAHRNSNVKDIELLAQPIYSDPAHDKPIIVFAGEATHSSFYSTTHGAFLSGRKAAYYLLDADSTNGTNSGCESIGLQLISMITTTTVLSIIIIIYAINYN